MVNISICLVWIFFLGMDINEPQQKSSKKIDDYLELSIELSEDTVSMGDEIDITVIFKNKTDSVVSFYPNSILYIINPIDDCGLENYMLNSFADLRYFSILHAKGIYTKKYKILIHPETFQLGSNIFHLYYINSEKLRKELPKLSKRKLSELNLEGVNLDDKLFGTLESDEFEIYVNKDLFYPNE